MRTEFALTQQKVTDIAAGNVSRRFDVELLIVHPSLNPAEISTALGLEARYAHRVGDRRKTPKGTLLSGDYPDTRWRHCVRCSVTDQWYAAEVTSWWIALSLTKRVLPTSNRRAEVRA